MSRTRRQRGGRSSLQYLPGSRATRGVDQPLRVLRQAVAAPRDVTVRAHQHQPPAVQAGGFLMPDAMHGKRDAAAGRGALQRLDRLAVEIEQRKTLTEEVED